MRVDALLDQDVNQRGPARLEAAEHERLKNAGEKEDPVPEIEARRHLLDALQVAPELFHGREGSRNTDSPSRFIVAAASCEI